MDNNSNKLTFKLFLLEYKLNFIISTNTVVLNNDRLAFMLSPNTLDAKAWKSKRKNQEVKNPTGHEVIMKEL